MPTRDEPVDIVVDGQAIRGTIVAPNRRLPGVLFVHGWGGSQEQYLTRAREVAALGCVCLTFDLRGHVETHRQKEKVSREDNLRDVLAAAAEVQRMRRYRDVAWQHAVPFDRFAD